MLTQLHQQTSEGLLALLNMFSGGAFSNASIFALGIMPYISASIVIQLLGIAVPYFQKMQREGESGRRKMNQYTRYLTILILLVQAPSYLLNLKMQAGPSLNASLDWTLFMFTSTIILAAGSMFILWLGERITDKGIGNGISLVIFAGIVSQLPTMFGTLISSLINTTNGSLSVFGWFNLPVDPTTFWVTLSIAIIGLAALYLLVKINEAQRVITINYAKRVGGNTSYGGVKSILPVKLIAAGVIPVIFAVAFLSLPAFIGQVMKAMPDANQTVAENLIKWFQAPTATSFTAGDWGVLVYPLAYFLLVIAFTYFYTGIVFNSNEIAENLQKQGGFIEGIRPGGQTERYLQTTVNRLILFGSLALGLIAVMPFAVDYVFAQLGINAANISIGGTGLLIVVTVGLETLRQINSRALMVTYDDYK